MSASSATGAASASTTDYNTPEISVENRARQGSLDTGDNAGLPRRVSASRTSEHLDVSNSSPTRVDGLATVAPNDEDGFAAANELQTLRDRTIRNTAKDHAQWGVIGGAVLGGGTGGVVTYIVGASTFAFAATGAVGAVLFTGGLAAAGALLCFGIGWYVGTKAGEKKALEQYGSRDELSKQDQQAVDSALENTGVYAGIHNMGLDEQRTGAIRESMKRLMLDRRAMFGTDYTPEEVKEDLEEFGKAMTGELEDLDQIEKYRDTEDAHQHKKLSKKFCRAAVAAVKESIQVIADSDDKCESALTDWQNQWYVASDKWRRLHPSDEQTQDMTETLLLDTLKRACWYGQNKPTGAYPNIAQVADDYESLPGHLLRRFHDRMNRIAHVAGDGAATVSQVCEKQRSTCELAARSFWTVASKAEPFPELGQTDVASRRLADGDKQLIRDTTVLAAYIAAADFHDS